MKALAIVAALVAVTAPAAHAATTPKLRLVTQQPLTVRGEAFRPSERIAVTAMTLSGPRRVLVRTTPAGRFSATFRLPSQPCGRALAVLALGSRGSRASLNLRSAPCIPPPRD
ncbi:MAG TPA: hypothetical protein VFO26_12660 [Gaiella sp.]|uniref:hypothetical protein n=1 Tax=Gaiella sp. TaxID=2663207 RepID=UPI002D7FC363|nr:hypothetical protein [Gaiella sp.]HET9288397.1 hypothetical protein [Gaiella sp.]